MSPRYMSVVESLQWFFFESDDEEVIKDDLRIQKQLCRRYKDEEKARSRSDQPTRDQLMSS